MALFHKILFPFDFSEAGKAMAAEVREMASRCSADLTALYSFNAVRESRRVLICRFAGS